jgi:transcriptional regulator with XRE-family HTH domain
MDTIRLGLAVRALRIRLGWRQIDVAVRVGLSRGTISNIERGRLDAVSLATLRRVAGVLGADVDVRVRWRGEQLDRLLDAAHSRLVSAVADRLTRSGWNVAVEVTFSHWGERGSVDILAFHRQSATLLVVEVKTVVPDFQAMVAGLDRKARLGPEIARNRGWQASSASRLLVIEAGSTSRDRIQRVGPAAAAAVPDRGMAVRSWLRHPSGSLAGLMFVRSASRAGVTQGAASRQRVRRRKCVRSATGGDAPESSGQVLRAART